MITEHDTEPLSASLEDYLEAISAISREQGSARVKEIAALLSVHKSTVTAALQALAKRGLANYVPYQAATLTCSGQRIADDVTRRHLTLKRFLKDVLLVDDIDAEENACRLEHAIAGDVLKRLVRFLDFAGEADGGGNALSTRFRAFLNP